MEHLKFKWDENEIKQKHSISFEEAKTVFYDELALVIDDPDHSDQEDRFIILSQSSNAKHWLHVIAIANLIPLFALYQRGKQPKQKPPNIMIIKEVAI